jgi:SynChlorMet cassette protein ScmC
MKSLNINESWTLKLTDQLSWSLSASTSTKSWLRKLASIMELKPGPLDGLPKVHFVLRSEFRDESGRQDDHLHASEQLSSFESQWTPQKFGLLRWWTSPWGRDAICELPDAPDIENDVMMMSRGLLPLYRQAIAVGGIPMHAALLEYSRFGFMIAASGGVGKSTCCHRLPPPWNPLCDDETLILPGPSKLFLAHPFPTWSEYLSGQSSQTWGVESHITLGVVFFLCQATMDKVVPISKMEAAIRINHSAVQVCDRIWRDMDTSAQRRLRCELFNNACTLAKAIPCFELCIGLTGQFWEDMDRVLPHLKQDSF